MADLVLDHLTIAYKGVAAVDDLSLHVRDGEFLTLLGPSGCGKSTTLFAIAGLNPASSGTIRIGTEVFFNSNDGINLPPEARNIGLVFQSYALWPHKTVAENLAFPLELRKISQQERSMRILEALELVEMASYASRYPFELSGGQQQRVALARALVYRPRLLLLDEPLSNLDAKLRERARIWLRDLQARLKVTTVYVTHDQAEALAISDRIAVMNMGRIQQISTPKEIYQRPANAFVADFIGSANILSAELLGIEAGISRLRLENGIEIVSRIDHALKTGPVTAAIRPEHILIADKSGQNAFKGTLLNSAYLGSLFEHEIMAGPMRLRCVSSSTLTPGDVHIHLPEDAIMLFPRGAEER